MADTTDAVTLTAGRTSVPADGSTLLKADAGGTPYYVSIWDLTTNEPVAVSGCCAAALYVDGVDLVNGPHTYRAFVTGFSGTYGSVPATYHAASDAVTLSTPGYTLSITSRKADSSTFIVEVDSNANTGPNSLQIEDVTSGVSFTSLAAVKLNSASISVGNGEIRFVRGFVGSASHPLAETPIIGLAFLTDDELLDSASVAALEAQLVSRYAVADEQCLALGEATFTHLLEDSAPDATLVCNAAGSGGTSGLRAALQFLINTVGGIAAVVGLYEAATQPEAPPTVQTSPPSEPNQPQPDPRAAFNARIYARATIGPTTLPADTPSPAALEQAAQQCQQLAMLANTSLTPFEASAKCADEPTVFVGGAENLGREAAIHDAEVISDSPQLVELNYVDGTTKQSEGTYRKWYTVLPYNASCAQQTSAQQCDEYPYFASEQGGPQAWTPTNRVLKPILTADNKFEGNVFSAMVSTLKCGFRDAAGNTVRDKPFLVVPLPDVDVTSFFVCPASGGGN